MTTRQFYCMWFLMVLGLYALILILPLPLLYRDYTKTSLQVSPGDTRLLNPSVSLCQSISLNAPSTDFDSVTAYLYRLETKPSTSAANTFTISKTISLSNKRYEYWSYYLYPGSSYSVEACAVSGQVTYYAIKGFGDFDIWTVDSSTETPKGVIDNPCGSTSPSSTTISVEDEYYFVFYNTAAERATIQLNLTFNRFEYRAETGGVTGNCTQPSSSSCSLDIPYNLNYKLTFLIETSPPKNGTWDANVYVSTTCGARAWAFAVIEIGVLLILVLGPGLCVCVLWLKCRRNTGKGDTTTKLDTELKA